MIRNGIISYFKDNKEISEQYSDSRLIALIKEKSRSINGFSNVYMWFAESENSKGTIMVDISSQQIRLGNHEVINIYEIDLSKETFSDYVKEGQRIKRLVKKMFPDITVSSNFR